MYSSKILFFHMLSALAIIAVRLDAGAALPIVHFINGFGKGSAPIDLHINVGGLSSSAQIMPGQDYGMRVKVDDIHRVTGIYGSRFTSFHAYEAARDKGRAAIFWRANGDGFAMSHDKVHWKTVARWNLSD